MDQPMPAQAPQAQGAQQSNMGPTTQLVSKIHEDMGTLQELLAQNPQIPDEIKSDFDTLVAAFDGLVEKAMNTQPQKQAEQKQSGPLPMMAGAGEVKPAL